MSSIFSSDKNRVVTAAVIIVVLAVIFLINNFILTWIIMGILFGLCIMECMDLYKIKLDIFSIILLVIAWLIALEPQKALIGGLFVLCISSLLLFYKNDSKDGIKKVLFFIYPTLPFLALFTIYSKSVLDLLYLIVVVCVADIAAYYGGKAFGKRALCHISPKKTIEGAIIGIVIAVIVGGIVGIAIFGNFYLSVLYCAIIVIASIVGDLFESYLKRSVDVKDSGSILPGHGGILDRMDAILFGAIAFLLFI